MATKYLPPSKLSPNRPPDWRWERARWYNEQNKKPNSKKEDEFVIAAFKFQNKYRKCNNYNDLEKLKQRMPEIYDAYELVLNDSNLTRYQIEARLLANESFERISSRCFVPEKVIFWYEKLFFNVLDAINSPDYLSSIVLGRSLLNGVKNRDYDMLWKLYGLMFRNNTSVLDSLLTMTGSDELTKLLELDIKNTLSVKAALAARTIPIESNQIEILQVYNNLKNIEKNTNINVSNQLSVINKHISALVGSVGEVVKIGEHGYKSELEQIANKSDFKTDELIEISQGKIPEINFDFNNENLKNFVSENPNLESSSNEVKND